MGGTRTNLLVDRFVIVDQGRAVDLASGDEVVLVTSRAGGRSEQLQWTVRCDELCGLHHRAIAPLLDYGALGAARRFEAWRCGPPWRGAPGEAALVQQRVAAFLRASGLTAGNTSTQSVRAWQGRPVVLPDPTAGYRANEPCALDGRLDACGMREIDRPAVAAVAEMLAQPSATRPRAVALWGPTGSGVTAAALTLARIARQSGFVPLSTRIDEPPLLDGIQGRSIFLINPLGDAGWDSLLEWTLRSPRGHILLFIGRREDPSLPGLRLDSLSPDALIRALRPPCVSSSIRERAERAATKSSGLPGRFARLLWGPEDGAAPPRRSVGSTIAAEERATYGDSRGMADEAAGSGAFAGRPAKREIDLLRGRLDAAIGILAKGRHAPGDRAVRSTVAALARRRDWDHAARGSLALASSLLKRGRPREAQTVLAEARRHGAEGTGRAHLTDAAVLAGIAWTDLGQLDEAENVLRAAVAAAGAMVQPGGRESSCTALARCLFWRGRYQEAGEMLASVETLDPSALLGIRVGIVASRVAVGLRDFSSAVSRATQALEAAARQGEPGLVAEAASAAALAHLAVGDRGAVDRDVETAVAASRAARDPLRALKARLIGAENGRRLGRGHVAGALLGRVGKLAPAELPLTVRARCALLADLLTASAASEVVKRHVAATGLGALALFAPAEPDGAGVLHAGVHEVVEILRCCQSSDEDTALSAVCARLRGSLRAACVAFFGCDRDAMVPIASDGGRIDPAMASRVAAARQPIPPHEHLQATEGGAPVRFGGEVLGAIVARWSVGAPPDPARASTLLTMAAVAAGPAVAAALARRARPAPGVGEIVGGSAAIAQVRQAVERAAPAPFAVLIEGESGAGKELVARALHRRGARRDRPFCTLNCAALPDDLIEAELFGHARGAFTGAVAERPGVFEEAHTGTLFLDEVGELSARAQAKILRTIQEGELRRVGENIMRRIDVRVVSATNRDLHHEVAAGRFRLDLLYRLDVIRITVPPLRERPEDIALLVEHVWREASGRLGSRAVLSAATVAALAAYSWPGNVRELQNVLAALAVRSPRRGVIPPTALPPAFLTPRPAETWRLEEARRSFDERFVRAALVRTGGHRARAAEELGVTRQGLTKLMARLGISR